MGGPRTRSFRPQNQLFWPYFGLYLPFIYNFIFNKKRDICHKFPIILPNFIKIAGSSTDTFSKYPANFMKIPIISPTHFVMNLPILANNHIFLLFYGRLILAKKNHFLLNINNFCDYSAGINLLILPTKNTLCSDFVVHSKYSWVRCFCIENTLRSR